MDALVLPISEHEDVKKVFALYQQHGMGQEKQDVEVLVKHIEFMETQFSKVFDELQNVRSQLQTIEDKSVRATVTRIVDAVDTKVTEAKAQFTDMKNSVVTSFSNTVQAVKEKGVSALQKTVDFLKVHSALSLLKGKLDKAVNSLQRGVAQIECAKTELHTAKTHRSNAGRLMFGKEPKDAPAYDSKRGILAGIQKALSKTGTLLANISKVSDSAMRKIEGLGQWKEESSVGQFIKDHRAAQAVSSRVAPEKSALESR